MMEDKLIKEPDSFGFSNGYYDLFYQEKAYEQETQYVDMLLHHHGSNPVDLLELGSGTGNYSNHLCNAGYNVTGIEKSPEMLAVAISKKIPRFYPVLDDIITFSINRKFDAAVSLFHVVSYLTENADILSCFKRVARHLHPNGVFIFDVWYTPAVYSMGPETRVKRINTSGSEIVRLAEPRIFYERNVVQVDYTLTVKSNRDGSQKTLKETHFLRHYSTTEIELLAELAGLKVIQSEEFLTRKKPSNDTWGVCFILKKNE